MRAVCLAALLAGPAGAEGLAGDALCTAAWTKLSLNCAGAVNALTGAPGGVVRADGIAELMREMVWECVRVGRAVGRFEAEAVVEGSVAIGADDPGGAGRAFRQLHAGGVARGDDRAPGVARHAEPVHLDDHPRRRARRV